MTIVGVPDARCVKFKTRANGKVHNNWFRSVDMSEMQGISDHDQKSLISDTQGGFTYFDCKAHCRRKL